MKKITSRKLAFSGIFIALGLVLPFMTAQIPSIGQMLLPMHLPVLLCGFAMGGPIGLLVGFILPPLRHLFFTMPPLYPTAIAMAFELAAYGFFSGMFYRLLPKNIVSIYANLVMTMIAGRIVWGGASLVLYALAGNLFTWQVFFAYGFVNALPGLILQIVVIPPLVIALKKVGLFESNE